MMAQTLAEIQIEYSAKVIELNQMHASGDISDSESKELLDDLLDVDRIKGKLDEQEDILQVAQAIEIIAAIAKAV